jgi:hypothetical protein
MLGVYNQVLEVGTAIKTLDEIVRDNEEQFSKLQTNTEMLLLLQQHYNFIWELLLLLPIRIVLTTMF